MVKAILKDHNLSFDKLIPAGRFIAIFYPLKLSKNLCGNSSIGRALPCQGKGRGFESRFPLQILLLYLINSCCNTPQIMVLSDDNFYLIRFVDTVLIRYNSPEIAYF